MKRVLSIEWDSRRLRLVLARLGKTPRVLKTAMVLLPEGLDANDAALLGRFLKDVLAAKRMGCKDAVCSVPRDQAVVSTLSLPQADLNELAGMVQFQVSKDLPFSLDQAVIDFALHDAPKADKSATEAPPADVLVAAVRHEVIDHHRQVCEQAGLKLHRIGLRPHSNKIAVDHALGMEFPGRLLLVDLGPTLTEIDVIRKGRLVFSRAASVPIADDVEGFSLEPRQPLETPRLTLSGIMSLDETTAEQEMIDLRGVVNNLLVEVTRSVESYRSSDHGAQIDRIIVSGSSGIENLVAEALHRRYRVSAEVYRPHESLRWKEEQPGQAAAFSAVWGLAVGQTLDSALCFDFLHPKRPMARAEVRRKKIPAIAATILLFAGAAVVFGYQYAKPILDRMETLDESVAKGKESQKKLDALKGQVETAQAFVDDEIIWLDEIRHILPLLPDNKDMYLTKMYMFAKEGRIDLQVLCKSDEVAYQTVDKLTNFTLPDAQEPRYSVSYEGLKPTLGGDAAYPRATKITITLKEWEAKQAKGKKKSRK